MGKTTTVRPIIGFSLPRSGIIRFHNREIQGLPPYEICQMGLALVLQGRRVFSSLSVEESLLAGAFGEGMSDHQDQLPRLMKELFEVTKASTNKEKPSYSSSKILKCALEIADQG